MNVDLIVECACWRSHGQEERLAAAALKLPMIKRGQATLTD
jgi:hypothetical protein